MNLNELKLSLLEPKTQVIVFHASGNILSSCESMVSIESVKGGSFYDIDPLFQSMEHEIQEHPQNSLPMFIPCVEFDFLGRKGYFDFQISIHPEDAELRVLLAIDNSPVYKYYQKIQQERNELLLEKQSRKNG